ncbi:MAG: MFS transporter [Gammaproteobacteria bacterium]|nr:MFS transporter [Gammaproteobacteria bacterium]NND53858.1 MFS transporter [Gammaproteobacteria bacterium]
MTDLTSQPDKAGLRLGPLWFMPGYTGLNIATVNLFAFVTIAAITFMGFAQPYVLTEILQIPAERQGTLTGNLAAAAEVFGMLFVGFFGAWSDKVGRRPVLVIGFAMIALSYFLYPLANSESELVAYRLIFAVGCAAAPIMMSAAIQDSVQEASRGKWVAVNSICTAFGVLFMALVLARLPDTFVGLGYAPDVAGRYAFWVVAGFCVIAGLMVWMGIKRGVTAPDPDRTSVWSTLRAGLRAARENPRIAVAYGAAFIGRGDLVIVTAFLSLWVVQYGTANGVETAEALKKGGILFAVVQGSSLLWSYFMGLIIDRINRLTALALGVGIATVGYSAVGLLDNPFASIAIPVAVILGIGEISVVIGAASLVGQDAPIKIRGTVIGVFSIMGSAGITFATLVGGMSFDKIGPTAPFMMMGILNLLLFLAALWLRLRERASAAGTAA